MSTHDLVAHLLVPDGAGRQLAAGAPGRSVPPSIAPQLERGDTLVAGIQRLLRASWGLDPVILETHLPPPPTSDAGYVGLAVLEPPPPEWVAPAELRWTDAALSVPDRIAPRATTWLAEWASGAEPPELRPRWSRPGWHARATRWIRAALATAGLPADGPVEMRRLWSISALARIPHDAGRSAWFKAVFPHFHHEPAVTALLERLVPGLVPPVLAVDADEGWMLLDEAGAPLPDAGADADPVILAAIGRLVDAHEATLDHLGDFAALGCPRRPLSTLAEALVEAMSEAEALGGEAPEPGRLATVAGWVADQASWLAGLGMPDVLVHGDFHPGNLLVGPAGTRIIDWSDAAIAHPAMDIGPWFGEVAPALRPAGWQAWTSALARFGPVDELRARERDAYGVACAYQVVSYAGILRGIEPANRYQLRDGFVGFWKDLDAAAPR